MAAILAAFDNAEKAVATLSLLANSPFARLLQPHSRLRLLAFSNSQPEVERLQEVFPASKVRQTQRLLDNAEGGMRGAIFGIVAGVVVINLVGLATYFLSPERATASYPGSLGALIVLFTGFLGAVAGGMVGFGLGKRWIGLPPALARRYEYRLERGELIVALNQRRLLLDRPRRLRPTPEHSGEFSLEKFRFWLGEHGAHDTRQVSGSVAALKVTPSPYNRPPISPFHYSEPDDAEDEDDQANRKSG